MKLVTNHGTFRRADIKNMDVFLSSSISGTELSVDTMEVDLRRLREIGTVFQPSDAPGLMTADGKLFTVRPLRVILTADEADFTHGEQVLWYDDNDNFAGKFYMKSLQVIGDMYAISYVSHEGLLDSARKHYGGVYSGLTVDRLIAEIIGDLFPYTVDAAVTKMQVRNGYLPIAGRRENLQQVLFAYGICVKRDANQDPYFTVLSNEAPIYIPDSDIYIDGEVTTEEPASQVNVTEHQYSALSTDTETTLFIGAVLAEAIVAPSGRTYQGAMVEFDAPYHDLAISGGTILESGANYAVLSAGGNLTLKGKAYTHVTRTVLRTKPGVANPGDREVRFPSCTMVCPTNADAVADRMIAFYGSAKTVIQDIKATTQRPGDYLAGSDPRKLPSQGFIGSMDISISRILRAAATIITGVVPTGGQLFEHSITLTGTGYWTVPEGVNRVRYSLVQAAQGGAAGKPGAPGATQKSFTISVQREQDHGYWTGDPGKGGPGGKPGKAGKVYRGTLEVTPGQRLYYKCGVGGLGAVFDPENPDALGAEGGHTTLEGLSSASGEIMPGGMMDVFTGKLYATPGVDGIAGGDSAGRVESDDVVADIRRFVPATQVIDEDGVVWTGGMTLHDEGEYGGVDTLKPYKAAYRDLVEAESGYQLGSGAAAGANGTDGTERGMASARWDNKFVYAKSAAGLNGATATKTPKKAPLTIGGRGGYGGGGGSPGSYAFAIVYLPDTVGWRATVQSSEPGQGGEGSEGGQGGDGIILLEY